MDARPSVERDIRSVEIELLELDDLRWRYQNTRRSITELWLVAAGMSVVMIAHGGWLWVMALPISYLVHLALQLAVRQDCSRAYGRELDEAFDDAAIRLRKLRTGEAA